MMIGRRHSPLYGRDLDLERWLEDVRLELKIEKLPEWDWEGARQSGKTSVEAAEAFRRLKTA